MEILTNAISWFEIPVDNFDRAKKFYSLIYDYDMPEQMMGNSRMGFLISNAENGGIGGAIVAGDGNKPAADGTLAYLNGGSDLEIVLNRVETAGGKILLPKTQISPEIGYFAIFMDSEGNRLALHSIK